VRKIVLAYAYPPRYHEHILRPNNEDIRVTYVYMCNSIESCVEARVLPSGRASPAPSRPLLMTYSTKGMVGKYMPVKLDQR
jgi:hypothetical protein